MHANKPGAITFFVLELLILIYLHHMKGNKIILYFGSILIAIILGILISMLWITPESDSELHITLAGVAFAIVLIYNITTLYILYKNYKNLALIISLIVLNIVFALSLTVVVSSPTINQHILEHDFNNIGKFEMLFAISEIIVVLLFMVTIMMLGFYGSSIRRFDRNDKSKDLNFEEKIKKVKK